MPTTPFTQTELSSYYQRALKESNRHYPATKERLHEEVVELMRCRPLAYYDDIKEKAKNGTMPTVEMAYFKTPRNGHHRSITHDGLEGLYFHNFEKSVWSYYGNCRMRVKPEHLLDTEHFNWYFADFYCLGQRPTHHRHKTTLVVARKESSIDQKLGQTAIRLPYDDMEVSFY